MKITNQNKKETNSQNMQLRFRTSAMIAAAGAIGQVNALSLTVEAALNAAASSSSQPGTLQYGEATQAQIENVHYHDIQGQAAQSIHGSKLRIAN